MTVRELPPSATNVAPMILQNLSLQEKKALAEELLCKKSQHIRTSAPMSKGQQSLWFIHQNAPDSPAYNVAMAFYIYSPVDQSLLEKALNIVIQRHAILRTSYAVRQRGESQEFDNVQEVNARARLTLARCDARILTEEQLHARITADYRQPFDLASAMPLRAHLYTLAQGQSVFMLVIHHIAIDATSLWVLMAELEEVYQTLLRGNSAIKPNPSLAYQQFCRQQALLLTSDQGRASQAYWVNKLAPDLEPLTLDISKPRPAVQVYDGASHYFEIPEKLTGEISALAKSQAVTPYVVLLAAYYCLLSRHSGQADICVASPTLGRLQSEFMSTIGYFVNPVIIRTRLPGNSPFSDFLQRVNDEVLESLEHQQYPFASVIEAVNPKRDSSYTPFSQTSFVFQNPQQHGGLSAGWAPGQRGPRIQWAGLDIRQYPLSQQEGQFELELEIAVTKGRFYAIFKYNNALFTAQNMQMLEQHFRELLAAIADNPHGEIARLNMLTQEEQQQQLHWNDTRHDFPAHQSLHQLIEQQVVNTPDRTALSFAGADLSYREMNCRANRMAHYLMQRGVSRETKVGVCMDRSFDMVITLLAILKAGGAYVPIDPNYPPERLGFLLNDMDAFLLLSQTHLLEALPVIDAEVVPVERLQLDEFAAQNPRNAVAPENLAYMIYTSGSTGKPKGAMNTHAAICNRLLWMQDAYSLDQTDTVLQKTPFSFDVSVWEFFWPLISGARLVIAKPDGHRDSAYLIDIIRRENITTLHFVPSMLSLFVADENSANCHSIKRVICSGEALSHDLQQRFFQRLDTELHNLYGPTEAAIDVTAHQCSATANGNVVPIGKPIANIQIHILDQYLQRVPVGVNGELHIGGIGVARGYFKREELTASKFIPDPFCSAGKASMYKTGDLVRYLADGSIEYLQRMDDQVKLRGFRIELGEVEAMLCRCEGVREAVVVKREHPCDGDYLVAFATRGALQVDAQAILEQLAAMLPVHSVPAALVFIDAVPLSSNGKVDRRALPEHSFKRRGNGRVVAPRTEVERKLHALWRELLKLDQLSVTDDFFAIGGHSLLAVRLVAAIELELGQRLPLASLVKHPTIAALAELIDNQHQQSWDSLVTIQAKGDNTPLFFLPGGGGNVLYFYPLAEKLGHDRPFYGLQARGLDGITAPLHCASAIATEMVKEIKQVQANGPYILGGHCVGGLIAFAIAQQLAAAGDTVEQLLILDAPAPHFFRASKCGAVSDAQWISVLVDNIAHMTGLQLSLDSGQLETLDHTQQLERLRAQLSCANVVPDNMPLQQIQALLQVFKANAQLHFEGTAHGHPIPVSLFRARDLSPHFDYRPHDDPGSDLTTSSLGWRQYATGPVQVQLVEGDHITMLASEHAQSLAAAVHNTLLMTGVSPC